MRSYIVKGLSSLFKFLPKVAKFLPAGFSGVFIVTQVIIIMINQGIPQGFAYLAQSIFGAGLTINQNVWLAINDAPEYTLKAFIAILVSLYVIYSLVRVITKVQLRFAGSQAPWSAAILSIIIVAFIQMATIYAIEGVFGWFPIRDDILFLFMNIGPVLGNIF